MRVGRRTGILLLLFFRWMAWRVVRPLRHGSGWPHGWQPSGTGSTRTCVVLCERACHLPSCAPPAGASVAHATQLALRPLLTGWQALGCVCCRLAPAAPPLAPISSGFFLHGPSFLPALLLLLLLLIRNRYSQIKAFTRLSSKFGRQRTIWRCQASSVEISAIKWDITR